MAKSTKTDVVEIDPQTFRSMIYVFRGQQVMLDADLAAIYGYSTKAFNRQVKNNSEKFDEDFMFQLTDEEIACLRLKNSISNSNDDSSRCKKCTLNEDQSILKCKNCTSSEEEILMSKNLTSSEEVSSRSIFLTLKTGRGHNIKYAPYAFTEQGIYMLMTVLKGDLATRQSKALIRTFKQMKDYIVQNQNLLGQREFLQLSLQTTQNTRDLLDVRSSLTKLDDKVADIVSSLGDVVTKSQLADIMLDFGEPAIRRGWLILNGQPVESDLAYQQIYSSAKQSIMVFDNYIGLKTLALMKAVPHEVKMTIVTDNVRGMLHLSEYNDFVREYPDVDITLRESGQVFHDRYIVIDYKTPDEQLYHCGASSKDGGNKITTIHRLEDITLYRTLIDNALLNPLLGLR